MPTPPRRRPAAGPTARRPKVAGLRKPTVHPESEAPETAEADPAVTNREAVAEPVRERAKQEREDAAAEFDEVDAQDSDGPGEREAGSASGPPPPGYRGDTDGDEHDSASVDNSDEDRLDEGRSDEDDSDEGRSDEDRSVVADGVIAATPDDSDESHEDERPKRPSPTGKRRAGSRAVPANLRSAERSAGGPSRAKAVVEPGKRALNLAIGLAVVALLMAALGLYFKGQADRLTSGADQANIAFTDPAATAEVKTEIVSGLERALSYDYRDLDKTAVAVREVLAGKAVCEYDAMFGQLRELAPAQKLVHTTIVRELGVRHLSAERAEALVFIDQTSTRVEQEQTTASGAQLGVTAERVDGQWKITAFDTFNQPLPNGQPLPQC